MNGHADIHDQPALGTREDHSMRCLLAWLMTLSVVCLLTGCGGTLTQEDMRRHAIRRSRDKEEPTEPAAAKPSKQDVVSEALDGDPPAGRRPQKAVGEGDRKSTSPQAAASSTRRKVDPADTQAPAEASPQPAPTAGPAAGSAGRTPPAAPTFIKPHQPLSPIERRQRTLDNLTRIGDAIRRYTQEKKQVFAPATSGSTGKPLLSWRVDLLPYLGYEQLYNEFQLAEPWDSPHNKALLARIPDVYQSPERFDEKTNYVVPKASYTAFSRLAPGVSLRSVEDGPANTVAVVEVDDVAAVPWTQPADLELDLSQFRQQVATLREDGFFVVWLDGSVGRILRAASDADLKAVFTYDASDSYAAYAVRADATAAPAPVEPPASAPGATAAADAREHSNPATSAAVDKPASPVASAPPAEAALPARLPVPNPLSLEQARKLVRELYQQEYEAQKDPQQQRALAQKMLQQAGKMTEDPAGQYVLLDTALKIATRMGDVSTALTALEQLVEKFTLAELELTHETLVALAKKDRDRAGASQLLTKARGLIDQAIHEEQFETAESLCQIATGAARQTGDREAASQLVQQAAFVAECQKAFKEVRRILTSATDADDPDGNLRVGRYYCFIRGEWEKGLPLLAKGNHPRLQELAEADMRQPTVPADQLKLADGWWDLGTDDTANRVVLQERAAYWYERALPELPSGLWRAKADMRLKEYRRIAGSQK